MRATSVFENILCFGVFVLNMKYGKFSKTQSKGKRNLATLQLVILSVDNNKKYNVFKEMLLLLCFLEEVLRKL